MSDQAHETVSPTARYQMLDVWRGVVNLVVVLEHAGVALWNGPVESGGWAATFCGWVVTAAKWNLGLPPLFFVMSGYCIAASLRSSRRRGENPLHFLVRRLWRIFPTYWAAFAPAFIFPLAATRRCGPEPVPYEQPCRRIGSPRDMNRAQWLGNLTLTETWR